MDYSKLVRKIALIKEAKESEVHKSLTDKLLNYATENDFTTKITNFPNGLNPDVLQYNETNGYLFVGDAKNSQNETSDVEETYKRIFNYVNEFSRLLSTNDNIKGGCVVIATDSKEEADKWKNTLDLMAIINDLQDSKGNFSLSDISKVDDNTWFICI